MADGASAGKLLAAIDPRIVEMRGLRVMLSPDLARLYGVETRVLMQAVRRNIARFPADFMFELSRDEAKAAAGRASRSQDVILNGPPGRGTNVKYLPYAFTEQGVAMLSSVLRSDRAVLVNIEIMRTFVKLRSMLASNAALTKKLDDLEERYDAQFRDVFDAIRELTAPPKAKKTRIGFIQG